MDPADTRSTSALRRIIRSGGVELEPSPSSTVAGVSGSDSRSSQGMSIALRNRQQDEVAGGSAPSSSPNGVHDQKQRCVVVSKHGQWPTKSAAPAGGNETDGHDNGMFCIHSGKEEEEDGGGKRTKCGGGDVADEGEKSLPTLPFKYSLRGGAEYSTISGAAADSVEVVTLLWLEACHRVRDVRVPSSCGSVFRPRPWPIHRLDETTANCLKIAVTGFVGGERTGWEQMITGGLGAELCKSLRKRVTTHLVCKEVKVGNLFNFLGYCRIG